MSDLSSRSSSESDGTRTPEPPPSALDPAAAGEAGAAEGGSISEPEEEEQFDITLPAAHSYLSDGLQILPGRYVLETGWTGRMPCVVHHGVLFPGETLPMIFSHHDNTQILIDVIQSDCRLFGILFPDESGVLVSGYGVVCEVLEARLPPPREQLPPRARPHSLALKARARQRFRLVRPVLNQPIHEYSRIKAVEIRILPDIRPGDPLWPARLTSLDPLRHKEKRLDTVLRRRDAMVTGWPLFVYDIYDYERISNTLREYFKTLMFETLPTDMVSLSYWVAANMSLTPRDRLALFAVDNALLRLHIEVEHIHKKSALHCCECSTEISNREDVFAMSSEGLHSNFCNIGGYIHDLLTVSKVQNVRLNGEPELEFTWFPGYAWTIALCQTCLHHVGWRFTATKKSLRPQQFWGLCRNYVAPPSSDPAEQPPSTLARALVRI